MPYLNIRIAAVPDAQTAAQVSAQVAATLTELTANVLGKKRELTAVQVDFVNPTGWFIAGQPVVVPTFYLDIQVTEGTNTKNEKAAYIRQVFAGLAQILGTPAPASYIVIHELRADAWGYQGETQEARYIRGCSPM